MERRIIFNSLLWSCAEKQQRFWDFAKVRFSSWNWNFGIGLKRKKEGRTVPVLVLIFFIWYKWQKVVEIKDCNLFVLSPFVFLSSAQLLSNNSSLVSLLGTHLVHPSFVHCHRGGLVWIATTLFYILKSLEKL